MESLLDNIILFTKLFAALIPVVLGIYQYVVKPIRTILKDLTRMDADVKILKAEMMINSGSTVKDKINMIMRAISVNESRWKLGGEDSTVAYWECDETGRMVRANKAMQELFGLAADQMMGNGWFDSVISTDRNRVHEQWVYACKHAVPYQAKYGIINCTTQIEEDVIAEGTPVVDTHGHLIHWFGTCRVVGKRCPAKVAC